MRISDGVEAIINANNRNSLVGQITNYSRDYDDYDGDNVNDDDGDYFVDSGKPYFRGEERSQSSPLGRILGKEI